MFNAAEAFPTTTGKCLRDMAALHAQGNIAEPPRVVVNQKLGSREGKIERLAADGTPPDRIVTELYLQAFGRPPVEAELAPAIKRLEGKTGQDRRDAIERLYDEVLNSRLFRLIY